MEHKPGNFDDVLRPLEAELIKRDLRELDAFDARLEAAIAKAVAHDLAILREHFVLDDDCEKER